MQALAMVISFMILGLIIILLLSFIFIEVFCKKKTFSEIMLISIQMTLVSIFLMLCRDDSSSNINTYLSLIGGSIFLIALTINIYGLIKNGNLKKIKDAFFID
ncbi:hypothetical protein [Clostridium sp. LIBA-8841]|uniref:hypothetical protein n=1 Tax=Clostridium sp. LIBA-8841 TaxID=2987530 RepID=UPI002AC67D36|nr:hypothetical protein [Clostridium sp. LIBA-8841]MDZ5252899.1 hypothetical protein [Clostridium sp. LIBA-8841]